MNLIAFDSPDRSICTSARIRTNTPIQALNLLNDQTFFEASQSLAEVMFDTQERLDGQIALGYKKAMGKSIGADKLNLFERIV